MIGITAWGAYIPRARLSKQAMADANTWFDAGLKSLARGERSICNWDEDTITMAVEAGRDCLSALKDNTVASLYLASTTLPFLDRQNSVVVTEALNLDKHIRTMDISASQRAAGPPLRRQRCQILGQRAGDGFGQSGSYRVDRRRELAADGRAAALA